MSKINPTDSLNASIPRLAQERDGDFLALREHLRATGESMQPANLIKGALRDIAGSHQFKSVLIKAALGIGLGVIAKKLVTSQSENKTHRAVGNALQYGISFLAAERNNLIKSAGMYAANTLIQAIRERRMAKRHLRNGTEHLDSATG